MANLALLISQVGLWAFLLAIMPLLPGDGYNWLATYLGQPMLRQKAFFVLRATLRGTPIPPRVRPNEVPMLIIFAVSSIITMVGGSIRVIGHLGNAANHQLAGARRCHFPGAVSKLCDVAAQLESSICTPQAASTRNPPVARSDNPAIGGSQGEHDVRAVAAETAASDFGGCRCRTDLRGVSAVLIRYCWTVPNPAGPAQRGNRHEPMVTSSMSRYAKEIG